MLCSRGGDGVMKGLNRHVERVFNPDHKDTHWRKTEAQAGPMAPRFEIKTALPSIPKASIPLQGHLNVRQVALTENLRNEFVVHNFLHHISHKLGAGDSAFLCCP